LATALHTSVGLFFIADFAFASVQRSTGNVRLPLAVSMSALSLNTVLSYVLIFGKLGLPALGVEGAALAGLIARLLECGAMVFFTYHFRTPAAASLQQLFSFNLAFIGKVLKPVAPVIANEALWSMGITAYYVAYARIGTEPLAAMNIVSTIDGLAMVIFIGVSNACAILVGNLIGAGDERTAFRYAARSMALSMLGALGMGGMILVSRDFILSFYKVSPETIASARLVLTIIATLFWLRMSNLMLFIGVFRSGGDTRFAFLLDGVIIRRMPLAFALSSSAGALGLSATQLKYQVAHRSMALHVAQMDSQPDSHRIGFYIDDPPGFGTWQV
jgi:Na+-driven multidrug efflux pump